VRESARLLEGVRQGQPIGALLGYRFERRLHDLKLDRFISRLRALAPLVARARASAALTPAAPSVESVAANNVVDGLVLPSASSPQVRQRRNTIPPASRSRRSSNADACAPSVPRCTGPALLGDGRRHARLRPAPGRPDRLGATHDDRIR
jgi:hypothetical protein